MRAGFALFIKLMKTFLQNSQFSRKAMIELYVFPRIFHGTEENFQNSRSCPGIPGVVSTTYYQQFSKKKEKKAIIFTRRNNCFPMKTLYLFTKEHKMTFFYCISLCYLILPLIEKRSVLDKSQFNIKKIKTK